MEQPADSSQAVPQDEIEISPAGKMLEELSRSPQIRAERLAELKSEAGMIQADAINRRIIVNDRFQKLRQMEQLLEMLDVDRPMLMYHLNSIGIESSDAQDLVDNVIEPNATQDAFIYYNESQGVLIVKDVVDVHNMIRGGKP